MKVHKRELKKLIDEGLEKGHTPAQFKRILVRRGFEKDVEKFVKVYGELYDLKFHSQPQVSAALVLLGVVLGTTLIGIDKTITNLALPSIITFFGITLSTAGWVSSIYVLTSAVFIPVFGKLGSMIGNRKLYLWGFFGFILTSIATGLAWNISSLIFFRMLQGVAAASLYPTAMTLITKNIQDRNKRAQALGIYSALVAASAALGPLVGGPIIDHFSWRAGFFINLPVGIVGLIMAFSFLPKDAPEVIGKFDYLGAILLGISLSSLILALDKGAVWGYSSWKSILLFVLTGVFGFLFFFTEKSVDNPMVNLKLFTNQTLSISLLTSFISFGIFSGVLLAVSLFTQKALNYTATLTGYLYLPMIIGFMVCAPLGATVSKKINPNLTIALGFAVAAFGAVLLSGLGQTTTLWHILIPLGILGVGLGLGMAPLTTAVTSSVAHSEVGVASGLLNLIRNISGAFGIAFIAILLGNGVSYRILFFISTGLIALSAVCAFFIRESKRDFAGTDKREEPHAPMIVE